MMMERHGPAKLHPPPCWAKRRRGKVHKQGRPNNWGVLVCRGDGTVPPVRRNRKLSRKGGLSEERLRKVNMHDVCEKDLEKHDKRRRKHKIGEQRLTGFFGGQHDEHSKYADGHADVE